MLGEMSFCESNRKGRQDNKIRKKRRTTGVINDDKWSQEEACVTQWKMRIG